MTMPNERTRALRWAGEFLQELQAVEGLDPQLKRQAVAILRHYPTKSEIEHWAICSEKDVVGMAWLEPEA